MDSWLHTLSFLGDRKNWGKFSEGDFNRWTLNHVMAVHPAVRFLTALVYKSDMDGRARLHYKDSKFLKDIKFEELNGPGKPYIFHNAFNFTRKDIALFANDFRDGVERATKRSVPQAYVPVRRCLSSSKLYTSTEMPIVKGLWLIPSTSSACWKSTIIRIQMTPRRMTRSTKSGSTGLWMRAKFASLTTCMTRWQIFARCSRRQSAKMTLSYSNITWKKITELIVH